MKVLTALEARNLSIKVASTFKGNLITELFKEIRKRVNEGRLSCNYYTGGYYLSEAELFAVESLGFKIRRNSSCLWYEVSWK